MVREQAGLVVSALVKSGTVERHGDDRVEQEAGREVCRDEPRHQGAELLREGVLAAVFERVDRLAKGTGERSGRPATQTAGEHDGLRLTTVPALRAEPLAGGVAARATPRQDQVAERGHHLDGLVQKYVTDLRCCSSDRPGRQLEDLIRAARRRRKEPGAQRFARLDHVARAIDPYGVYREAHEPHRDRVRARDPEPFPILKPGSGQQAEAAGQEVICDAAVGRERRRPRAVEDAKAGQTLEQEDIAVRAAGARMTMNSDGKMHPTVGNMMRIGAFAALFSAR